MNRYTLTQSAESDLLDILAYIAERDGTGRALHIHAKFVEAFEALAASPGIGTRKPELTTDAIRWWPVFRFLVVYDAERKPIDILRIFHGARDLVQLFPEE